MSISGETRGPSRGLQFFILACTLLVVGFGSGAATVSLSAILQEFALSYGLIGAVTSGVFLFLIVSSHWADACGRWSVTNPSC